MTELELFIDWAWPKGFTLDHTFMSTDGVPVNPFEDRDTKIAFDIWRAARSTLPEELLPKWIPVSERMPEDQQDVLAVWVDSMEVAYHFNDDWWRPEGTLISAPSHWMPLPATPSPLATPTLQCRVLCAYCHHEQPAHDLDCPARPQPQK